MGRVKRWVCGWIVFMMLCAGVAVAEEGYKFEAYMPQEVWDSVETRYCGYESPEAFAEAAHGYIEQIVEITGANDWHLCYAPNGDVISVKYEMTQGISNAMMAKQHRKPVVQLQQTMFELGIAPVAHESVHLVLPQSSSHSLLEGIASYLQAVLCDESVVFDLGIDAHEHAKFLLRTDETAAMISEEMGRMMLATEFSWGETRSTYYILSHSFVKYLVETYGMEAFMTVYLPGASDSSYVKTYGKPIEVIRDEWIECLDGQKDITEVPSVETYMRELIAGFAQGV